MRYLWFIFLGIAIQVIAVAQPTVDWKQEAQAIQDSVVQWRRHLHQNPELSNREFQTADYVARHLRSLNLKVEEGVAHTGVVGILEGERPGPILALRADMDALPVTERSGLPFASQVTTTYKDRTVGVSHACGHDAHVAILMGVAEVLSRHRTELSGTIKFIFQPAEEGAPQGEEGGADLMIQEGVLENPKVDAIFGLHVGTAMPSGTIGYRSGPLLASSNAFEIKVKGVQSHGSTPWQGHDPIVAAAHIVTALQTIVSREIALINQAAVVSVGAIHGGVRSNIIPESCTLTGTIRALSSTDRDYICSAVIKKARLVAEAMGCEVEIRLDPQEGYPVTYNDPELTRSSDTILRQCFGQRILTVPSVTGAEDFAFYAQEIPAFFFFLGVRPQLGEGSPEPGHHTPDFILEEKDLWIGVEAFCQLVTRYQSK